MGDRANVYVRQHNGTSVWLYTHWRGSELPWIVQRTLLREQRWNDPPYLARMIFCKMLDGDLESDSGFGISTGPEDNNGYPYIEVDPIKQRVRFIHSDTTVVLEDWSFKEYIYINLPKSKWQRL